MMRSYRGVPELAQARPERWIVAYSFAGDQHEYYEVFSHKDVAQERFDELKNNHGSEIIVYLSEVIKESIKGR